VSAKSKVASFEVEAFASLDRDLLDSEAERVARLRGQDFAQTSGI